MYRAARGALLGGAIFLSLAAAIESTSFERTLNVTGQVDLDVTTGAGGITVSPGTGNAVQIRGTVRISSDWAGDHDRQIADLRANPPIEQKGDTIRIGPIADEEVRRHVAISYEIATPAATRLRAKSGAGAITVEGIQGPVDAHTGAGRIRIARVDGEVNATSGAGRVEIDGVKGKLVAHTGAGSIEGRGLAGPVNANTGSGSVRLEQAGAAPVEAHTGSGSLNVRLWPQAAFELSAHTGMGQVRIDPAIPVDGTVGKREVKGKVRGGGPLISLSTGVGSVHIEQAAAARPAGAGHPRRACRRRRQQAPPGISPAGSHRAIPVDGTAGKREVKGKVRDGTGVRSVRIEQAAAARPARSGHPRRACRRRRHHAPPSSSPAGSHIAGSGTSLSSAGAFTTSPVRSGSVPDRSMVGVLASTITDRNTSGARVDVVGRFVKLLSAMANMNWSYTPPASTSVVISSTKRSAAPAVNCCAKYAGSRGSLSVRFTPSVSEPLAGPETDGGDSAVPPPKSKLLSTTALLPSPVPLPSPSRNVSQNAPPPTSAVVSMLTV